MDHNTVNTVLVLVVLPVVGGLWRTLIHVNKTLARLDTALSGYDGKSGALARLSDLGKRTHRLESIATALLVHTGVEVPPDVRT